MKPILLKAKDVQTSDANRDLSCVIPQKYNGILVNFIKFDKNSSGIKHYHPDGFELILLVKGYIDYDGQILDKKGDMICFPTGSRHSGYFIKGTEAVVIRNSLHKVLL